MIRIVTDSTCDLAPERVAALGIDVLPLHVYFGDEMFLDGMTITNDEFYDRLSKVETLPTTSQVTPDKFEHLFRKYVKQGDQVLGLFISSEMSGTWQSACIARSLVDEENIFVPDTRTVTFALGLLIETACIFRDEGYDFPTLCAKVTELIPKTLLLAVLDTLKYLKMGGRISAATALVGGVLGIAPIISVDNGLVNSVGKARGRKAAFQWMEKRMETDKPDLTLPVSFGHTNCLTGRAECMEYFKDTVAGARIFPSDIGAVVGTHIGPGAAGLAYFRQ